MSMPKLDAICAVAKSAARPSPPPDHRHSIARRRARDRSCFASVMKRVVNDVIVAARGAATCSSHPAPTECIAPTPAGRPCTGGALRMKGTEPCGYVIRYGSFQAMVFSDRGGNGRGLAKSLSINARTRLIRGGQESWNAMNGKRLSQNGGLEMVLIPACRY